MAGLKRLVVQYAVIQDLFREDDSGAQVEIDGIVVIRLLGVLT